MTYYYYYYYMTYDIHSCSVYTHENLHAVSCWGRASVVQVCVCVHHRKSTTNYKSIHLIMNNKE